MQKEKKSRKRKKPPSLEEKNKKFWNTKQRKPFPADGSEMNRDKYKAKRKIKNRIADESKKINRRKK